MACPCCVAGFCCSGGPPANVTVQFYSPVVVDSKTPGYDPITPFLGTYVLLRDTVGEAYVGLDGTTAALYGLYPAGKTWQDALSIPTSQWKDVPTGAFYITAQVACNSGSSVSLSSVSVIGKAINNTTAVIFGTTYTTAYRTAFNTTAASVTASCRTSATSAEATQIWNHVEVNYTGGTYTGTSGAYFDSSKTKVSINY